ncbi:glycosyltransferase family 39 protein [Myxococcus sp. MxC21-1]|nr:glycosyltransferase family 39 protein [Myxococcus sp. MxC21-1]
MSAAPGGPGRRRDLQPQPAAALALPAGVARPDRPFSIFFYGDARFFHAYAADLARGHTGPATLPYHPPLFPWLLGLLYRVLGPPQGSAYPYKLALALLNAGTVAFTGWWWRKVLGTGWSLLGAALFACSFGWLVLSTTYSNEVLYVLFLSATCALMLQHRAGPTWTGAVLLGAVMGLGSLTRAEHLYLWPFLLAWAWLYRGATPPRTLALRWGAALLVTAVVLAPWAIHNARVLRELNARTPYLEPLPVLAPVTVYGPINFAMANHAAATGGFTPDSVNQMGQEGFLDVANPAQRHLLLHGYAEGSRGCGITRRMRRVCGWPSWTAGWTASGWVWGPPTCPRDCTAPGPPWTSSCRSARG